MKGRLLILVSTCVLVGFGFLHLPPPAHTEATIETTAALFPPPRAIRILPEVDEPFNPVWTLDEQVLGQWDPELIGQPGPDELPPLEMDLGLGPVSPAASEGALHVPEPTTSVFLAMGLGSVALYRRRVRRRRRSV